MEPPPPAQDPLPSEREQSQSVDSMGDYSTFCSICDFNSQCTICRANLACMLKQEESCSPRVEKRGSGLVRVTSVYRYGEELEEDEDDYDSSLDLSPIEDRHAPTLASICQYHCHHCF